MAKKAYWEMYEEVKNLKPRTQKYYQAVSKMFGLEINKDVLMKVSEFRKNEAYKKGKTFSQAVKEYEQGIAYENKVIQRAYDIWSGSYFEHRTNQYVDNYINALEKNNIDDDILDFLRANPEIIKMGAMPPITQFYIPSRGKGKKYSLNIENSEDYNDQLREFLREAWGADL